MCDKCIKRAIAIEIGNIQSKINSIFKKIEANPKSYKNDLTFIGLIDCMENLIEKYRNI